MNRSKAKEIFVKFYCKNRAFCELYPDRCKKEGCEIYHAIKAIDAEPKHGRWIPIAEAEPPLGTHVLVTYKHGEDDYETSELDYGMSKVQNTWHWRRVIAWQPMPEPYEEVTL